MGGTTIFDPAWIVAALAAAYAIYKTVIQGSPASGSEPKPAPPSPPPPTPPVIQDLRPAGLDNIDQAVELKAADLIRERVIDLEVRRRIGRIVQAIQPEDYKL